ncbi:zinc finger BED domain-containing protein RICESLEEPER 2-like [Primulina tabacum]|uniref:zinc finger BED domain-containing protein RICESLEEPER 2-like n=1 Tax=Primulina tabacum TaxID=48773 RepID=UPI003F5A1859
MLESAISLKRAFDSYADIDLAYVNDLLKPPYDGIPSEYDWERASLLVKFLGHFYKLTLAISGSLYVTSNIIFHEISAVDMLLKQWLGSDDFELSEMSRKMKDKFDKYWGSIEKMNMMLYYAVILDPRHKLEFVEFSFDTMYDDIGKSAMMKEKVKSGMQEIFFDYKVTHGTPGSPVRSALGSTSFSKDSQPNNSMTSRAYLKDEFRKYKLGGKKEHVKSELEKYIGEDPEDYDENFDILQWWKVNSPRFPILSRLARDILAIPVSTVASESAFSTGGRVLDAFRSSLSPRIVQALVCTQDWLRLDSKPICVEEDLAEIEILEKDIFFVSLLFYIYS